MSGSPLRLHASSSTASWIWSDLANPAPVNCFTAFRRVVQIDRLPNDGTLLFAASSTAQLWVNGTLLRRKVARYDERHATAEVVDATPYLRQGANVVFVLHHNWGPVVTFQRTGNAHAGLYIASPWVVSDEEWQWATAPQFKVHQRQILGRTGDPRIRFPIVYDAAAELGADVHLASFEPKGWRSTVIVTDATLPVVPEPVETPGQREAFEAPYSVLAAGTLTRGGEPDDGDVLAIAASFAAAIPHPDDRARAEAAAIVADARNDGGVTRIAGRAGESRYVTVDFARPVHGYPVIDIADATPGAVLDLGYGEVERTQYDGARQVREDGWIDTQRIVGAGYADRVITRRGDQIVELPDERTARWLGLHVHFAQDGFIDLRRLGFVTSQYPISPKGSFHCGDARVEQIVKLCLIHAELTMTDSYVDTPSREDGQWIEDARPRALIAQSWFGDWNLRRLMIRTHAQAQRSDGALHPFAPSNYPAHPAPYDWSMQWVAALHDDWMWTGSLDYVSRFWTNLVRYWDELISHIDDRGLFISPALLQDIRVTPPLKAGQSSGMITPAIAARLRWSARLAAVMGDAERQQHWTRTADRLEAAFGTYHVIPASGTIPAHVADRFGPEMDGASERGHSQAGQLWAVLYGLLGASESKAAMDFAFPDPDGSPPAGVTRWNNPTWTYRALRALTLTGRSSRAVAHLLERYAPYLPGHPRNPTPRVLQGPYGGPLPEYWISRQDRGLGEGEINTAQPVDDTGTHGWGAVPLLWMHDSLLGVCIVEPGGARIEIAPDSAGLPYVAGHVVTPRGTVWVCYDPQKRSLEMEIPPGVVAQVRPPGAMGPQPRATDGHIDRNADGTFTCSGRCVLHAGPPA